MKSGATKRFLYTAAAAAALCSAGLNAHADYASQLLAFQPLTYWRFSEAGPFSFTATNVGTLGAAANGVYNYPSSMQGQPGALAGSTNTAAGFNGSSDKIDVPFNAALNPASFTVECWAKVQGGVGNYRSPVTSRESSSSVQAGYIFYAGAGNTWEFWTGNGTSWNALTTAATNGAVVLGAWTHLVGTYDATSLITSFYINGALVMQGTNVTVAPVGTVGSPCPLRIGAGGTEGAGEYWFDGSVDEVAVYPSVLTAAQVAAHFAIAATNGPAYPAQVLSLQPALYLRLDDSSANPPGLNLGSLGAAANGAYNSSVQPSQNDLVSPAFPGFGTTNTGLVFDGNGESFGIGYTNLPTPWTAVFWVNPQVPPGASAVLMASPTSALKLDQYDNTLMVGFTAYGVADYVFNYEAPTNTWVNLVFVGTSSNTLLYADGFLQDSNSASITLPMTSIGNPSGDFLSATVDEVAMFGTALLEGQIRTLYLTATGDQNPPAFVQDVPVISPPGPIYATTPFAINANVYGAGPLSYQWRQNGTVVGTDVAYAKASASAADNGNYDVIVANPYGRVTSSVVTLAVNPAQPPTITQAPAARPVYPGGNGLFTVAASGTPPLSFQWKQNGVNIPGATNTALIIANAGPANAVNYSVAVTNEAGGVVSANAALTIVTPTAGTYEAAVLASAPVAYWRLNEQSGSVAHDYQGANDGVFSNVTLGQPGYSSFDSDTSAGFDPTQPSGVIVSNSAPFNFSGSTPAFSYEIWAKFNSLNGVERLFSNGLPGGYGLGFGVNTASGLRFTTFGVQDFNQALTTPLQLNTWYHIAGVSEGGNFYFYVNGQPVGTVAYAGAALSSSAPFNLGYNAVGTTYEAVSGDLSEAAFYNQALTAEQVLEHFSAGMFGTHTAPFIVQQPVSETAAAGNSSTFSVTAQGSVPLSYQWSKAGVPLAGATNSTLTLSNIRYADAGTFSVTITNAAGTTSSAQATLTVLPVPTFANLTNGLVLHLNFNGGATDSSGRQNDASIVGSPSFVPGELGQAIELGTVANTSYNYLSVSDNNGDLTFQPTTSFSVALWLRFTAGFNDLPIIGNSIGSTYQSGWVLTEDSGKFEWTAVGWNGGSIIADPVGGPLINDGAWHHLAVVFDRSGSNAMSYVDGQSVDTRSIAALGDIETGEPVTIGQDPTGDYNVTGTFDLDDLGIWRRALSAYEVLSIYTAAKDSNESFDVYGPVKVSIAPDGIQVILAWQAGTLESADQLQGAQTVWAPVTGAAPPTYTLPASAARKFYRVKL
jgi:hypothetical protein